MFAILPAARGQAVHGRTRGQKTRGDADWATIKLIKDTLTIPVLSNGVRPFTAPFRAVGDIEGGKGDDCVCLTFVQWEET